jgi:hypothetical protein
VYRYTWWWPAARAAPRGRSLVTEAVGYLGGVIVVVALGLITGQFWPSLPTSTRLALAGGVTVVLLAAGWAVPGRSGGPGRRLVPGSVDVVAIDSPPDIPR